MSGTVPPVEAPVAPPVDAAPVAEAVAPAAVVETAAPEVAPNAVVEPPAPTTVIGDALAPPPVVESTVEPAPAPDAPKVEGQSDEPAPPPSYDPFTLPEGYSFAEDRVGEFTGLLGEFEGTTKADHAAVQAFGQKLVERHVAEVQRNLGEYHNALVAQFDAQKQEWLDQFRADPEIGGNRADTTVQAAIQSIRTFGGSDVQQAEFRELMDKSGLGNNPVMIRFLASVSGAAKEGRPLAASTPAAPKKSNTQKMYG